MNNLNDTPDPEQLDGPERRRHHHPRGHHGHQAAAIGMFGMMAPGFGPGPGGPFGAGGPFGPGGPMHGGRGRGRGGRRGHVRTSILALLAEAPLNGYQIMQQLAERTGGAWKPSPGTVYPTLSQLEDEGLIEAFENDGQKAYRLTEAGRQSADGIEQTPWDLVNERLGGFNPDRMKALWTEFGLTAGALKEFSRAATPDQVDAATKLVAETRRKLYGLLAAAGDDVPTQNPDDLR